MDGMGDARGRAWEEYTWQMHLERQRRYEECQAERAAAIAAGERWARYSAAIEAEKKNRKAE
jgi:hypothetical protein